MYRDKIEEFKQAIIRKKSATYDQDIEMLNKFIASCQRYVDCVVDMERVITIQRFRLVDSDAYRSLLQEVDRTRRFCHDGVIAQMKMINRLAADYDLPPLFEFPDREGAARIAGDVVNEYFESGILR